MNKKLFVIFTILIAASLALSACGPAKPTGKLVFSSYDPLINQAQSTGTYLDVATGSEMKVTFPEFYNSPSAILDNGTIFDSTYNPTCIKCDMLGGSIRRILPSGKSDLIPLPPEFPADKDYWYSAWDLRANGDDLYLVLDENALPDTSININRLAVYKLVNDQFVHLRDINYPPDYNMGIWSYSTKDLGRIFFTSGHGVDTIFGLYDTVANKTIYSYKRDNRGVIGLAPDGVSLITYGDDESGTKLCIWLSNYLKKSDQILVCIPDPGPIGSDNHIFLQEGGFVWSPDGKSVAIVFTNLTGDNSTLETFDISTQKVLYSVSMKGIYDVSWSPDSNYLAFAANLDYPKNMGDLYIVGRNGQGLKNVRSLSFDEMFVRWIP